MRKTTMRDNSGKSKTKVVVGNIRSVWEHTPVTLVVLSTLVVPITIYFEYTAEKPRIEKRIESLTQSLNDAVAIISEIEAEVNQRMKLVDDLERKAAIAQQLQESNREQVEAIALLFRSELERNEQWDIWINLGQNMIFTVLGAIIGYFFERWMSKRKAAAATPETTEQPV